MQHVVTIYAHDAISGGSQLDGGCSGSATQCCPYRTVNRQRHIESAFNLRPAQHLTEIITAVNGEIYLGVVIQRSEQFLKIVEFDQRHCHTTEQALIVA